MSKIYLPIIVIFVGLLALGALTYVFVVGVPQVNSSSGPTVFYQRGTIVSFDAAGNPVGTLAIVRVDGSTGRARKIFQDQTPQVLPNPYVVLTPTSLELKRYFTDPQLSTDSNNRIEKTTISLNGIVLSRSIEDADAQPQGEPNISSKITSDGSFEVTGSLVCLSQNEDEHCPSTFKLVVANRESGQNRELRAVDFGIQKPQNYFVRVVGFTEDERQAIVEVYWGGEPGPGQIALVRLENSSITSLYQNNVSETFSPGNYYYRSLQFSPDRQKLYVTKYLFGDGTYQLIEKDPLNSAERVLYTSPEFSQFDFSPDGRYVVVNGGFNGGAKEIDLLTGKVKQMIPVNTNFRERSRDGRYVAFIVYESTNGLGPQRLMLRDLKTGKERIIYHQSVIAQGRLVNAPDGVRTAGVGDSIYAFVGIF